jgi:hypothetical protein
MDAAVINHGVGMEAPIDPLQQRALGYRFLFLFYLVLH